MPCALFRIPKSLHMPYSPEHLMFSRPWLQEVRKVGKNNSSSTTNNRTNSTTDSNNNSKSRGVMYIHVLGSTCTAGIPVQPSQGFVSHDIFTY